MSCTSCSGTVYNYLSPYSPCTSYPGNCINTTDASCIVYSGPALTCSNVPSSSTLQAALQALDTAICAGISINWGSFNYSCIPALCNCTINSAQTFAEAVSAQFCNLNTAYTNFTGVVYPAAIASINTQINAINNPGLTSCSTVGVINTDTLNGTLTKILSNLCTVNTDITTNLATANWSQCLSVGSNPTTLLAAVNTLLDQICQVKASIPSAVTLPTFNNVGSCLSSPGTSDTLSDTVIKIRTLLCTLPTFDHTAITFGCVTPGTDLQSTIQNIITDLNADTENAITQVDGNFTLTAVASDDPCAGKKLSFTGTLNQDRLVALNNTDSSPGTLVQKLAAGNNITLDNGVLNAGMMTITAAGPDGKVLAATGDTVSGYLIDKLNMVPDVSNIISWSEFYNSSTHKLDVTPVINSVTQATNVLNTILGDPSLLAMFCAMACNCQPCTTTTSTTTGVPAATLSASIQNTSGSGHDMAVEISFTQLSPTVAWFDSGATVIANGASITTGAYTITASTPVTGTLVMKNNNQTTLTYNVTVVDSLNNPVPGSTTLSGTLATTAALTTNPFTYGTSPSNYKLIITLSR